MTRQRPLIDLDRVQVRGFGLRDTLANVATDWHRHRQHQLLYAEEGSLHLEIRPGPAEPVSQGAQWLLPPQRAAWIRAGTEHRVRTRLAELRTVYLSPELVTWPSPACGVFAVTPLARELLLHAMRWEPQERSRRDDLAEHYFHTLAGLCRGWLETLLPFQLPVAQSPELARAMRHALDHLERPLTLPDAARAAGVSPRTLTRLFRREARLSWRAFLRTARMLHAMDLLARPGARVTDVALAIGYDSLAAFSRSFRAFTGALPKDYRQQARRR